MNERTKVKPDIVDYLVSGLVLLVFGLLALVPSMLAYWHWMDENEAWRERLDEMGIGELPGVTPEDIARPFMALSVVGCIISAAGGVLVSVALLMKRGTKGSGPRTGERPHGRKGDKVRKMDDEFLHDSDTLLAELEQASSRPEVPPYFEVISRRYRALHEK